ncbi:MAG TPA: hypothetical protein VMB05_16095 [Solirubrobacteraceae bacterium]|nr:hypothetical protein [Solirubrobacteraceae bacterium]
MSQTPYIPCTIKTLPSDRWIDAAKSAISINPVNAPAAAMMSLAGVNVIPPAHLAILTSKFWGQDGVKLTVGFLESTPDDLQARILLHMNSWGQWGEVSFTLTDTDPQVRITREGDGYWSYFGTDIEHIPSDKPTMSLQGFTMQTIDSEFHRVVRHETGHTLGFPHEHLREEIVEKIDPAKAIAYFEAADGWNAQTTTEQVLTPLSNSALDATAEPDPHSIMCYGLPAQIMKDGEAIPGGIDIDQLDQEFIAKTYPKH